MKKNLITVHYIDYLNLYFHVFSTLKALTLNDSDSCKKNLAMCLLPNKEITFLEMEKDLLFKEVKEINVSIVECQDKLKEIYQAFEIFDESVQCYVSKNLRDNLIIFTGNIDQFENILRVNKYQKHFDDLNLILGKIKSQINSFSNLYRTEIWRRFQENLQ